MQNSQVLWQFFFVRKIGILDQKNAVQNSQVLWQFFFVRKIGILDQKNAVQNSQVLWQFFFLALNKHPGPEFSGPLAGD